MMTQAFYTGINGIQTHQSGIDVIADNLSNISTVGFRSYSAEFSSLFEEALNTSSGLSSIDSGIGLGATLSSVSMNEDRGSFMLSDRSTDLAILGDGWFGIQSNGRSIYTRDGAFTFDANRDLVTNDGYYVLGTMGSNITDGVLTEQLAEVGLGEASAQEKLRFPENLLFPVQPTTEVKFQGNLSVENTTRVVSAKAIDAKGDKNNIRLEFTQVDPQVAPGIQWNVVATSQSLDGQKIYDTQTGVVKFDESGALISNTLSTIDNNGAAVNINAGSAYDGITSISGEFYASSSSNGIEAGELAGYDINRNGEIVATFTNGIQSSVGAIAVYHFANDRGLEKVSGTRFAESSNSGKPIFFKDAQGKNIVGTDITNYKLESSNVKIEVALSEMIIMQRAYDANSKSITTADEMMQKALSMDAS
ncbi:MAG: flagellar hook-basal body complex protein [Sulfurimonas sp.]|uniref:flagellar hook protein FlgE n=1 Tax=Sulfurimonas sp. TaxID=2022749 RepID=UPI00262604F9|nr:flagellar hook-basal body complex protein [Sulfurimonas sp.]MDD5400532.1 flagellar hook-basal body complex protein [Sulfurimonas sp.]